MKETQSKKTTISVKRMALDALMAAMYFALAMTLTIRAGALQFSLVGIPVMMAAAIFGPVDAAIVGLLGEFLEQMLTFGLTPTTILWILPSGARGLFIGWCVLLIRKWMKGKDVTKGVGMVLFVAACILSGIVVSCLNTVALYVDSKMLGYYKFELVFGAFLMRIVTGLVSSTVMGIITVPIVAGLKRVKLVP